MNETNSSWSLGLSNNDIFNFKVSVLEVIHSVQSVTRQKIFCITTFKRPPGTASCTTTTAPQPIQRASSDTRKSYSLGVQRSGSGNTSPKYTCIVKGFIGGLRTIGKHKHRALVATDDKAPAVQGMFNNNAWGLQRKRCASGQKVPSHWAISRDRMGHSHDETNCMKTDKKEIKEANSYK